MSRTVTVTVTRRDLDAHPDPFALMAVHDAITRAVPGVTVAMTDPVDIEFRVAVDAAGTVTWSHPTPDVVARRLYHEDGDSGPFSFELTVPECLAAYLCLGPGGE